MRLRFGPPRYKYVRFLGFALLALLPLLVLCTLVLNQSREWARYITRQSAQDLLDKSVDLIDQDFKNLSISMSLFDSDETLHHLLRELNYDNPLEILRAGREYNDLCNRYFYDLSDLISIDIITPRWTFSHIDKLSLPKGYFAQSGIYKQLAESDGKVHWFPTYNIIEEFVSDEYPGYSSVHNEVFSIGKRMELTYVKNDVTYTFPKEMPKPVLLVHLPQAYFQRAIETDHLNAQTEYVVYDGAGNIVFCSAEAPAVALDALPAGRSSVTTEEVKGVEGGQYLVCTKRLTSGAGWTVASLTLIANAHSYFGDSLLVITILMLSGTAIYAVIMVFLSTVSFSRPFRLLAQAIQKTAAGDFQARIATRTYPDFQEIFDAYNAMNERITQLIRENYETQLNEKNLEIQVINLQFNPHFLYNTLNIISLLAMSRNQDDISQMVHSLAFMMRYSVKTPQGLVVFSEDIQYLDAYVSLMRLRFTEPFEYRKEIDPAVMSCIVPKFLLQPFIENALLHGFAQQERMYRLSIRAGMQGRDIVFEVEDDGQGISLEGIEAIWSKESTSLGIKNTHHRIQLYCGPEYGVHIESTPGKGTRVRIRIAMNTGGGAKEPLGSDG